MASHEYELNIYTHNFAGTLPQVVEWDVEKIEEIIPQEVFTREMACMVKESLLAPLLEVQTQMWGIHTLVHGPHFMLNLNPYLLKDLHLRLSREPQSCTG